MNERIAREVEIVDTLAGEKVSCPWAKPRCDKQDRDVGVERAQRASDASEKSCDVARTKRALRLDRERGIDAGASDLNRGISTTVPRKEFCSAGWPDFPVRRQPRP